MKPIAYINVEKRTLEFAKNIFWHTPTVANIDRIPLFTKEALAQTQEPVFWYKSYPNGMYNGPIHNAQIGDVLRGSEEWIPLYTHLPQRTWVGLTDEDCKGMSAGDKVVAMWVDRTLKEKNT